MVGSHHDHHAVVREAALGEDVVYCCPADRVVVSDGGHFIGWANMFWPVAAPDRVTA